MIHVDIAGDYEGRWGGEEWITGKLFPRNYCGRIDRSDKSVDWPSSSMQCNPMLWFILDHANESDDDDQVGTTSTQKNVSLLNKFVFPTTAIPSLSQPRKPTLMC